MNPKPDPKADATKKVKIAGKAALAQDLQQQIGELTEALQRERADIMNIRRRHDEQMANLRTTLKAHVIKDLLPVIDNFERALKHVPAELVDNDYIKGVQAVVKQFEKTLADMGVERIATVGEPFNPHYHEAVSMEEGDGDQDANQAEFDRLAQGSGERERIRQIAGADRYGV